MKTCLKIVTAFIAVICCLPVSGQEVRILSLNNSLIDYNDQAQMFNDIAAEAGVDAKWSKRTRLGRSLLYHYNDPVARELVASQPWDYIILQEMSTIPRVCPETFYESVKLWKMFIMKNCPNKDVTIIVPMNWAFAPEWDTFKEETTKLRESYEAVARDFPGVTVCYVGSAYEAILENEGQEAAARLYSDNRHPTPVATYLAALMEFGLISGIDPVDVKFIPDGVDAADASLVRSVASRALKLRRSRNY